MMVKYGIGRHIVYLDEATTTQGFKYSFISQPLVSWTLCTTKVSICLLLVRITVERFYHRIFYATAIFIIASTAVLFAVTMSQCRPLEAAWNHAIEGKCYSATGVAVQGFTLTGMWDRIHLPVLPWSNKIAIYFQELIFSLTYFWPLFLS